jgi:hypothetical protein
VGESEDLRQFIRDMITRFERRTDAMVRRLDEGTAQLRLLQAETRENTLAARDMREEMKAQRDGFLVLIDEIRGQQGSA